MWRSKDLHKFFPSALCALGIKLSSSGVAAGTLICWIFSPAQIEARLPRGCKSKAKKEGDCYFISASLKKWGDHGVLFVQTHAEDTKGLSSFWAAVEMIMAGKSDRDKCDCLELSIVSAKFNLYQILSWVPVSDWCHRSTMDVFLISLHFIEAESLTKPGNHWLARLSGRCSQQ